MKVVLEMPGLDKDLNVEEGLLRIEGRVDFAKYQG
jgi:hypothetical protein